MAPPSKKNQLSLFEADEVKFTPTLKESSTVAKISHGFLPTSGYVKKAPPKRKSRLDAIYLPEDRKPKTYALEFNEKRQRFLPGSLPLISRSREDVVRIIRENKRIGLDFEYNPSRHYISVVGVAVGNECAACKWDEEIGQLLFKSAKEGGIFVGHFVLGADKPVLEEAMNCTTSLETWDDSMVAHYLCKCELAKAPGKADDGEGGQGFMGLQFAAFFWTNVSGGYKDCRGLHCEGPCPSHSVEMYCAVDAYVGLEAFDRCLEYMDTIGIPRRVYEEHKELALNFCLAAQKRGIFVDLEFAAKLEKEMEKKKEALFPKKGGRFNPRSNIQVLNWFKKHDITLAANDKKTIEDTLEEVLFEKYGVPIGEVGDDLEMDEVTQALYDLYLHKCSGKGLDAWISEKYLTYE